MSGAESSPDISQFPSQEGNGTSDRSAGRADGRVDGDQNSKTSWADQALVADDLVDDFNMPDTLMHLIKNGIRFKFAKPWSETARPHLVKNLSVYFSVEAVITSENILEAFDDAAIDIDEITSIQRRTSNRTWSCHLKVKKRRKQHWKSLPSDLATPLCSWETVKIVWCSSKFMKRPVSFPIQLLLVV